jgi:hypothetical protein
MNGYNLNWQYTGYTHSTFYNYNFNTLIDASLF